jgi:methyl-accepting chemotaxis protein
MERQKNRRHLKNYLMSNKIQFIIAGINFVYMLVVIIVFILLILLPFYPDSTLANDPSLQNNKAKLFLVLLERSILVLIIIFILSQIHQTIVTHRIFGPLINFKKTFQKMAQGDFSRKVFLRKKDRLQKEADMINQMIDQLAKQVGEFRDDNQVLLTTIEEIETGKMNGDELKKRIKFMKEKAVKNRKNLSSLKLASDEAEEPDEV